MTKIAIAVLSGATLLRAVAQVLPLMKAAQLMTLRQAAYCDLMDFVKQRKRVADAFETMRANSKNPTKMVTPATLIELIGIHYPVVPAVVTTDNLWRFVEELLEWFCPDLLGPGRPGGNNRGWVARDDTFACLGSSPSEALFRWLLHSHCSSDFIYLEDVSHG